ncbi:G-protein coupled receptor Mth2-like isoform X10 [Diabrotica undecimpunctata]|uniref:G-protein coupled receptor Mth2-like isoform X10 n=1 Tax=Diabrotica undecimpunctata TaxID=50387 RepID=UPI003B641BB2
MFAANKLTICALITCCIVPVISEVILNHNTGDRLRACTRDSYCIKKCCPEHQVLQRKQCVDSPRHKFNVTVYDGMEEIVNRTIKLNVIHSNACATHDNLKLSTLIDIDRIFLQWNGTLNKPFDPLMPRIGYEYYCLETFLLPTREEFTAIVCYNNGNLEPVQLRYNNVRGMIISMPFLLLTFLVYLLLPERNLHRRALMSYVFTLLAAYITLVTIQLYSGQFPDTTCHVLGYLIIFFFLVSFFWMNVMCVDMWLAFSGMRTFLSKKTAERKRFIIYCIYAWGMPIIHVVLVFLINTYGNTVAGYHPQIGVKRCFLGEGMPTFYYFYLPMAILIGINITLFILTTVRIQKIKRETSMLKQTDSRRHTYEDDKQKFNLYLKLMFAMGINWITELVSWAVDLIFSDTPAFVWYITDFTNAMYGLLIFLIFVFKKKIWRSLKKKYYICIGKPHLAHSMTTSSARGTRTSNYSTTDTAVSTDYRLSDMKNGKIPEESALNRS